MQTPGSNQGLLGLLPREAKVATVPQRVITTEKDELKSPSQFRQRIF